jgi:hypothetical protein
VRSGGAGIRKCSDYLCQAQARGGRIPLLALMTWHKYDLTQIARDGCAPSQDLPSRTSTTRIIDFSFS